MWPFTKKKPVVPKRTLEFKTTPEETVRLCKLLDAWEAAKVIWNHPPTIVRLRNNDPLMTPQGPEECKFRCLSEYAQLCRLRIHEEDKTSNPPWPPTFSYSFERKGNAFHFTVEGVE